MLAWLALGLIFIMLYLSLGSVRDLLIVATGIPLGTLKRRLRTNAESAARRATTNGAVRPISTSPTPAGQANTAGNTSWA